MSKRSCNGCRSLSNNIQRIPTPNTLQENSASINGKKYSYNETVKSLIVAPTIAVKSWTIDGINNLSHEAIQQLIEGAIPPEIILIGTGHAQIFPPVEVMKSLIKLNIAYEIMDTPAACRTYNILATEGRTIKAGILL